MNDAITERASMRILHWYANISTTQRYMHLDDSELAAAQDLVE